MVKKKIHIPLITDTTRLRPGHMCSQYLSYILGYINNLSEINECLTVQEDLPLKMVEQGISTDNVATNVSYIIAWCPLPALN